MLWHKGKEMLAGALPEWSAPKFSITALGLQRLKNHSNVRQRKMAAQS